MSRSWVCLEPIEHDHVRHMPGASIWLTDEQAQQLLALGHIRAAESEPASKPAEPRRKKAAS